MSRQLVSSGSRFEPEIGFSRAVRIGNVIAVAGTAPIGKDGKTVSPDDVHGQTLACLAIIRGAIESAGARMDNVIRTRVMLTSMADWREAARAHGEVFGAIRPACTFVQVSGLIDPTWRVEIEADAVIDEG